MRTHLRELAVVAAVVFISALGTQACSSDDPIFGVRLLGTYDGPSSAELVVWAGENCSEFCDGEIDPFIAGVKGEEGPDDDDLDALLWTLSDLMDGYEFAGFYDDIEEEIAEMYDGELAEDEEAVYGPVAGRLDLNDACSPGTGSSYAIAGYTVRGDPEAPPAGKNFWIEFDELDVIARTVSVTLTLNNCTIDGDFIDTGTDEIVSLSGTIHLLHTYEDGEDGEYIEDTITGRVTVNPGVAEPTGTESTRVWGFNTPLTIDVEAARDWTKDDPDEFIGGACYDGLDASSDSACDGIFTDNDDTVFWNFTD